MIDRWTIVGVVSFAISACTAAGDPSPEAGIERIVAGEERDAQILVDLRDESRAYLFDGRSASLPLDDALLVCPDGSWMRLHHWISEQEAQLGFDLGLRERALFSLSATETLAAAALEEEREQDDGCAVDCYPCPDGAVICVDPCDPSGRTAPSGEGNEHGWIDSDYVPPSDGSGGGGWGSGSGSGSGSSSGSSSGSDDDDGSGGRWTPPDDGSSQPPPPA